MKIRTKENFQDAVDKETSWRKKELTAVLFNVENTRKSAKSMALRSGVALLYAHWEGLVKNIASYYLEYVAMQGLMYSELQDNFFAVALKEKIKKFAETNKSSLHNQVIREIRTSEETKAIIPSEGIIKTNSNLNSGVFIEIMETIGLDYQGYTASFNMLDTVLLKMRNEIAHGERLESLSLDEDRFKEMYEIITGMMKQFVDQLTNAVYLEQYKRKT